DNTENQTTREEGDKAKQGAHTQTNLNQRATVILHLHQMFIDARCVNQHVEKLRDCLEAEQHKHRIRNTTRSGGFWWCAAKNRFRQCKVSHKDLRKYHSVNTLRTR